ncbi:MAG TPA: hypothetical protein VJS92_08250 [Candidatus Polarisedimenticolaceae bacterium]|nr:hypothetical protein [Candidatus Polarisedimenticolaceae bacterium]
MTVDELLQRFPEIPRDLAGEPVLARFAVAFAPQLRAARNPSACSGRHNAENHYYLKLIGPLAIYNYGLQTRAQAVAELEALLRQHAEDPAGFVRGLVPDDAGSPGSCVSGCD